MTPEVTEWLNHVLRVTVQGLWSQVCGSEAFSVFRPLMKEKLSQGVTLIVDRYAFSGVAFTSAKEVSAAQPGGTPPAVTVESAVGACELGRHTVSPTVLMFIRGTLAFVKGQRDFVQSGPSAGFSRASQQNGCSGTAPLPFCFLFRKFQICTSREDDKPPTL